MIFTGGSCLRICFDLPRLSEDLDFDLKKEDWEVFNIEKLANDIEKYFKKDLLFDVKVKVQGKKRIYLKFAVLKELGIANESESDLLYVKIEPEKTSFTEPAVEIQPIFQYGYNFIVRRYNLSFLMTGKLNAIFLREWFSGKENEIDVKGRDFYDLYWYLEKGISPDYNNLESSVQIDNEEELYKQLKEKIENKLTSQKLSYDLKNFFKDQNFVNDFCDNYKEIIFSKLI